jgi:hypothetical protein
MSLIHQEQLLAWTGYPSEGYLERWLKDNHIPYKRGNGGRICTTEEAINKALDGEKPRGTWARDGAKTQ